MVFLKKKAGRDVYQVGAPMSIENKYQKKRISLVCPILLTMSVAHFLVVYITYIAASVAYITCIIQRAQQVSVQYFSEHSIIYHLYSASVAYITYIFQRAQQVSIQYFSEHSIIYHLYISASVAYITCIFQRA